MTETSHPLFARVYQRMAPAMDRAGAAEHRKALTAGLRGRVIEIGAGSGLMFPHYPREVTAVLAVEPEPRLRAAATAAARSAPVPIDVVAGVAEDLPARDGEFDAAVSALVLCSVRDQALALAEIRRVLRQGGQLRFYEHVVDAGSGGLHRVQKVVDATVWPRMLGGCHTSRDTLAAITAAGFVLDDVRRFRFPESRVPSPAAPHVRGRATLAS